MAQIRTIARSSNQFYRVRNKHLHVCSSQAKLEGDIINKLVFWEGWPLENLKFWTIIVIEPCHEIMVLFVLRNLNLQMRIHIHPVGLDVWFLVGPFVYFHTLCVRTVKALAYVISTIISWAGSILFQSLSKPALQQQQSTIIQAQIKIWALPWENVSSGGSDEVRLKLACSATEASMRLEILVTETRDITLSRQRTTKALISLRGCAGWSALLLFAYDLRHLFSWPGSYIFCVSWRIRWLGLTHGQVALTTGFGVESK